MKGGGGGRKENIINSRYGREGAEAGRRAQLMPLVK